MNITLVSPHHLVTNSYYIYFEITGDHCTLIGSQYCEIFRNGTIFSLNHICISANEKAVLKRKQAIRLQSMFKVELEETGRGVLQLSICSQN